MDFEWRAHSEVESEVGTTDPLLDGEVRLLTQPPHTLNLVLDVGGELGESASSAHLVSQDVVPKGNVTSMLGTYGEVYGVIRRDRGEATSTLNRIF